MAMEDSSKRSALLQIMGLALIFITVSGFVLGNFYYKSRKVNYQSVEDMCSAAAAAYGEALNKELDLPLFSSRIWRKKVFFSGKPAGCAGFLTASRWGNM